MDFLNFVIFNFMSKGEKSGRMSWDKEDASMMNN